MPDPHRMNAVDLRLDPMPSHAPGASAVAEQKASDWNVRDSADLYGVKRWGNGYFSVNGQGHVAVHPTRSAAKSIDLHDLVDELYERGIQPPMLIRFTDILKHRLRQVQQAFRKAIGQFSYQGGYRCVYPIKVNQQRHVVEEILDFGGGYGFGLEAGSKPELLAIMAMVDDSSTPIICNGFKDEKFIEAVILATKIGKNIIPVVESFHELQLIARQAAAHNVKPKIGIRVKLATRGAGKWEDSGGLKSKFGLSIGRVLDVIQFLKREGLEDSLSLLHFHLGSQISSIQNVKRAITESARVFVELKRLGAPLEYIDVGGGLGVDYDGSKGDTESSINYSLQEYANDVVYYLCEVCNEVGVEHPTIITESGRAVVAYHSVLVFNVLSASRVEGDMQPERFSDDDMAAMPPSLRHLIEAYLEMNPNSLRESIHDAQLAWDETLYLFNLGHCSLEHRVLAERLFYGLCRKAVQCQAKLDDPVDEVRNLNSFLADTYFCNLSIFQSLPDSWAIDQLFPIMPIHRLNERPTRKAIIADITCDSDGRINRFIGKRRVKRTLELHPLRSTVINADPVSTPPPDQPYYLAAFMVGAYQEILGDMHNLFGDTHAVHIKLGPDGEAHVEEVIEGDTVSEVLAYVQYSSEELKRGMRKRVEQALRAKTISLAESRLLLKFYEDGLDGYTYLE